MRLITTSNTAHREWGEQLLYLVNLCRVSAGADASLTRTHPFSSPLGCGPWNGYHGQATRINRQLGPTQVADRAASAVNWWRLKQCSSSSSSSSRFIGNQQLTGWGQAGSDCWPHFGAYFFWALTIGVRRERNKWSIKGGWANVW